MSETADDQWVIVEPGVIVLPNTGYEIRYEGGAFVGYHKGKQMPGSSQALGFAKTVIRWHMQDLLAVGIEP
jgi:hypothetical protein